MFRAASNRKVLEISGAGSARPKLSSPPGLVAGPETCFGPLGIIHRQWHRQKTGDEVNHQGERRRSGVRQAILHGHHRLHERMGKVGNVVLIFWWITRIDWRYWKTFLCLKPIRFHRPNSFQGGPLCLFFLLQHPYSGVPNFLPIPILIPISDYRGVAPQPPRPTPVLMPTSRCLLFHHQRHHAPHQVTYLAGFSGAINFGRQRGREGGQRQGAKLCLPGTGMACESSHHWGCSGAKKMIILIFQNLSHFWGSIIMIILAHSQLISTNNPKGTSSVHP